MKILDKIMYILIHAHYLPRFFSLNVNSFKPKKYLISRYILYYNDSEIKMQSVFLPVFCFFLSIYNMSFFVISVLPYVVIIHYNFFTYILHNLPHFRCHSTFFRKNGEIYPSARHPSTTSKAQTNITFLSLPLSYTVNASK